MVDKCIFGDLHLSHLARLLAEAIAFTYTDFKQSCNNRLRLIPNF